MFISMKRTRAAGFAAVMLAIAVCMSCALSALGNAEDTAVDTSAQSDAVSVTAADDADSADSADKSKKFSGVLLVSSVCGAMCLVALIWRGKDKTKYL